METKPALKICANCAYFAKIPFIDGHTLVCTAEEPHIDIITGDHTFRGCHIVRNGACKGDWYKPKVSSKESLTKRFRNVIARFSLKD